MTTAPLLVSLSTINLPSFDPATIASHLIALIPLVGGYLLAREGKGNLLWEILAVLLLVLATVVPTSFSVADLESVLNNFLLRTPVALLLIGLAFIRDGGLKMVVGLALIVVSGLVLLPH